MRFETGDLDNVPILLTTALADDADEWWVDLHLHDSRVRGGYIIEVNEDEVTIQDESGDQPWGETHPWGDVAKVVVP